MDRHRLGHGVALNQRDALCVYTTDGDLAIDNNTSENALRRVAIGRKNWLFCGSDSGGTTAAVLSSLIATCQRHKVDPFSYLCDVLDPHRRCPAQPTRSVPACPLEGGPRLDGHRIILPPQAIAMPVIKYLLMRFAGRILHLSLLPGYPGP